MRRQFMLPKKGLLNTLQDTNRMSKPLKILHVFGRMGRGGGEMRTMEIYRHIDRRRYQFHFATLSDRPGELDEEIRTLGGEVYPLERRRHGFARRFRELLQRGQFDVVCSHVLYYSGFILRLAARCHVPTRVSFFRSLYDGQGLGLGWKPYRKLMCRWIDRYATNILAVAEGVMAGTWRADWKADPRCQVIYNGLDLAPFDVEVDADEVRREFGLPKCDPCYIHIGRMTPPKNHLRLISIFAEVLKHQPAASLLLVGRGGSRIEQDVRHRVAELAIADRVVLCNERNDVPRLLQASDALIFPSRWEGLPGAVLEACAAGIPVLASDLPGVREIAARLPGVSCLSLDLDDVTWARTLQSISEASNVRPSRQDIRRCFAESEFTIQRCASRHCRIWQGPGPETKTREAA